MTRRFEWNQAKAAHNAQKHGVTFDEARTVFADPLAGIGPGPRSLIEGLKSGSSSQVTAIDPARCWYPLSNVVRRYESSVHVS